MVLDIWMLTIVNDIFENSGYFFSTTWVLLKEAVYLSLQAQWIHVSRPVCEKRWQLKFNHVDGLKELTQGIGPVWINVLLVRQIDPSSQKKYGKICFVPIGSVSIFIYAQWHYRTIERWCSNSAEVDLFADPIEVVLCLDLGLVWKEAERSYGWRRCMTVTIRSEFITLSKIPSEDAQDW